MPPHRLSRREWFGRSALGASLAMLPGAATAAEPDAGNGSGAPVPRRTLPDLRIRDVRTIVTAPAGLNLIVVKVETSEPGLHGLGCATFMQRGKVVRTAVDEYLRPFLVGKDPLRIEDAWQSMFVSSYWRNGPVLNNAISGVDMALWDILGKVAGLPVYQLLGGKARTAAETYVHVSGHDFKSVAANASKAKEAGYRYVRCHVGIPGVATYGFGGGPILDRDAPENRKARLFEPAVVARTIPKLFEHLRANVGDELELLHDLHERLPPILAMQVARDVEPYRLFFLEDPFAPEDVGYFRRLRALTTTPLAMGELFNNPNEWLPLVSERLIDFVRCHISQLGGLTPARKLATLCEWFGVRTAWHGPGDVSPVGHACNLHLDLAISNFGIQEARDFTKNERAVFPGAPELRDGMLWANERPGFGVEIDEEAAAKFPPKDDPPFHYGWGNLRRRDGAVTKP